MGHASGARCTHTWQLHRTEDQLCCILCRKRIAARPDALIRLWSDELQDRTRTAATIASPPRTGRRRVESGHGLRRRVGASTRYSA